MNSLSFEASYGLFDKNMAPVSVINVTDIISDQFLENGVIIIPAKTNFNRYFKVAESNQRHFLQIRIGNRKHNIAEDEYKIDIRVSLASLEKQITMVYYAYVNRSSNWKEIISGQLLQLKSYGILDEVNLYIHITDPVDVFDDVIDMLREVDLDAVISKTNHNRYEYPAIKLAYDLAHQHPDSTIIYLHTKGMGHNTQSRLPEEVALMTETFRNWRKNLELFKDNSINKIGLFPADDDPEVVKYYNMNRGWMWINFWYARASYLVNYCEEPRLGTNRWYFEVWLGGPRNGNTSKNDCYSLLNNTNRTYFNVEQMKEAMEELKAALPSL